MATQRSSRAILADARDTLRTAEIGLRDVVSDDVERRIPGLRNLVVFGRAVTNVLQNLRATEPEFDAWYQPYVATMRADPLLRYFYKVRSEILKQGNVATANSVYVESFDSQRDRHLWGSPPPNAVSMFIGDRLGGSGWAVQLPDGSIEHFYVKLPKRISDAHLHLPDAPREHPEQQLPDDRVETLANAYVAFLARMVSDATARFGSGAQEA